MLKQPMMEKLQALKLHGMIEGLERQEQEEATREVSFLDRLAVLIDQQWNWWKNQALARRVRASRLKGAACVENIDYRAERGLQKSVLRAQPPRRRRPGSRRTHGGSSLRSRTFGAFVFPCSSGRRSCPCHLAGRGRPSSLGRRG